MIRSPILDPHALPVIGIDDHLPAVDASELAAPRHCAGASPRRRRGRPRRSATAALFEDREPTHASVLVPLVERDGDLTVLLTQRTDHLSDHPGQISFPGGRAEADDADAIATALREAQRRSAWRRACRGARRAADLHHRHRLRSSRRSWRWCGRRFDAGARCLRGRRGVRGAAGVPDEAGPPPAPRRSSSAACGASSCRCPGRARRRAGRATTSSGARRRRCCATCTASSPPERVAYHRGP